MEFLPIFLVAAVGELQPGIRDQVEKAVAADVKLTQLPIEF
jgi:hypothetical protein